MLVVRQQPVDIVGGGCKSLYTIVMVAVIKCLWGGVEDFAKKLKYVDRLCQMLYVLIIEFEPRILAKYPTVHQHIASGPLHTSLVTLII